MPTISVIVSLYDKERYVRACLDSVLAQTLRADEYEVIVVDDGSTDSSLALAQSYGSDGEAGSAGTHVTVLSQANAGPSAARNAGLAVATGEYVCFVDADDTVSPNLLAHLLSVASRTRADVARCQFTRGEGVPYTPESSLDDVSVESVGSADLYRRLFGGPDISLMTSCACLYRRSVLVGHGITFDEDVRHTEDALLNAEVFSLGLPVAISSAVLYRYREVGDSLGVAYDPRLVESADRVRERLTLFELEMGKRGEVARSASLPLRRYLALYYTLAMASEVTAPTDVVMREPEARRLSRVWTESHAGVTFAELERDGALGPYATVYALARAGQWFVLGLVLRVFNVARDVRRSLLR